MYSPALNRDMECKVYGHAGRPVLFIPCQDGRFFDFEGYKMAEVWSPWIESGQVMVIAIDTIDKETWSDKNGNADYRISLHEDWIRYIGLPTRLQELKGIKEEDLTEEVLWKMAKRVRSGREDGSVGQVKKIYPEDTVKIFKIAMEK